MVHLEPQGAGPEVQAGWTITPHGITPNRAKTTARTVLSLVPALATQAGRSLSQEIHCPTRCSQSVQTPCGTGFLEPPAFSAFVLQPPSFVRPLSPFLRANVGFLPKSSKKVATIRPCPRSPDAPEPRRHRTPSLCQCSQLPSRPSNQRWNQRLSQHPPEGQLGLRRGWLRWRWSAFSGWPEPCTP